MPYGWEGNRRSGVTLAMHHNSQTLVVLHLQAQGLGEEVGPPAYALLVKYGELYLTLPY